MVLHLLSDSGNSTLNVGAVVDFECVNGLTRISDADRRIQQFPHADVLVTDRRDNRCPEQQGECVEIEVQSPRLGHIAHVEGKDDGNAEFQKLDSEIQVALKVRGVYNIDDHVRLLIDDGVARHQLLNGVCGQAVGARQIHNLQFPLSMAAGALLLLDRHAGIVSDVLAGARDIIEQCCLAGVRIAGQCNHDRFFHSVPFPRRAPQSAATQ